MTTEINPKANNHWMVKGLVAIEVVVLLGMVLTFILN